MPVDCQLKQRSFLWSTLASGIHSSCLPATRPFSSFTYIFLALLLGTIVAPKVSQPPRIGATSNLFVVCFWVAGNFQQAHNPATREATIKSYQYSSPAKPMNFRQYDELLQKCTISDTKALNPVFCYILIPNQNMRQSHKWSRIPPFGWPTRTIRFLECACQNHTPTI